MIQLGVDEDGLEFLSYLQTDYCGELMRENKMKIHIETSNLFFDNENLNEIIYDFFLAQVDPTKKLMPIEFEISDNYQNYVMEYFNAIKSKNNDKYNMLTHKNSKFLFYNFDHFLNRIGKQSKLVRHTKISDDDFALRNLQEKNWPYFVERLQTVSGNEDSFIFSTNSSIEENKIIYDTIENLCKSVYNVIYIGVVDNFREYLQSLFFSKIFKMKSI